MISVANSPFRGRLFDMHSSGLWVFVLHLIDLSNTSCITLLNVGLSRLHDLCMRKSASIPSLDYLRMNSALSPVMGYIDQVLLSPVGVSLLTCPVNIPIPYASKIQHSSLPPAAVQIED